MLPARSGQLAYCYLHEGMLFCYFPLPDTEIETGKQSNHNISCRGRGEEVPSRDHTMNLPRTH